MIWNPDATPENTFVPADDKFPSHIQPPEHDDSPRLELSFAEYIQGEAEILECLKWKRDISALGIDEICYCHLKFGGAMMV
jgi:hypothetical protein